jgi:hypothetical protein
MSNRCGAGTSNHRRLVAFRDDSSVAERSGTCVIRSEYSYLLPAVIAFASCRDHPPQEAGQDAEATALDGANSISDEPDGSADENAEQNAEEPADTPPDPDVVSDDNADPKNVARRLRILRRALRAHDRAQFARAFPYPVRVNGRGCNFVVRNPKTFVAHFVEILSPDIRKAILLDHHRLGSAGSGGLRPSPPSGVRTKSSRPRW